MILKSFFIICDHLSLRNKMRPCHFIHSTIKDRPTPKSGSRFKCTYGFPRGKTQCQTLTYLHSFTFASHTLRLWIMYEHDNSIIHENT